METFAKKNFDAEEQDAEFSPNPLLLANDRVIDVEVVDIGYCCVIVKGINLDGKVFYFSIELFPQNPKQNTKPVDDATASEAWPDRSNVVMAEAEAYWISHVEKNADGSRKGGAFALPNLSLKRIPIGATLTLEFVEETDINTVCMVKYGDAEPFKAFACSKPSPQFAVDTYIMCLFQDKLYIRVIERAPAGPDFPRATAIIGGFLNGGMTVAQGRAAELEEEGGIIIGDNIVKVFELGERNAHGREPRYMPFTYLNSAGEIVKFGCERGSTAHAVVHFVIPKDTSKLPRLAKATDEAEVVKGEWMPVEPFLAMSNDPAAGNYVAWLDHQAGASDAVQMLKNLNVIE